MTAAVHGRSSILLNFLHTTPRGLIAARPEQLHGIILHAPFPSRHGACLPDAQLPGLRGVLFGGVAGLVLAIEPGQTQPYQLAADYRDRPHGTARLVDCSDRCSRPCVQRSSLLPTSSRSPLVAAAPQSQVPPPALLHFWSFEPLYEVKRAPSAVLHLDSVSRCPCLASGRQKVRAEKMVDDRPSNLKSCSAELPARCPTSIAHLRRGLWPERESLKTIELPSPCRVLH
jgi:hypothetical protein